MHSKAYGIVGSA